MELDASDLEVIAKAKRKERFWKYGRFLELFLGLGVVWLSFWLIHHPEILSDVPPSSVTGALAGLGGGILGALISRWTNRERQLLMKLAANVSPRTD